MGLKADVRKFTTLESAEEFVNSWESVYTSYEMEDFDILPNVDRYGIPNSYTVVVKYRKYKQVN